MQILLLIEHVPGQPHDVLGLAVRFGQHGQDVLDCLPELAGDIARFPFALAGPADLAGDEDELPRAGDAVRAALGAGPARRLGDLQSAHCARPLSLKRWTFPVSVRGSASRNSIARGYL